MVLHFQPALPCAQLADDGTHRLCGVLTSTGVLALADGAVWTFVPLCLAHYQQVVDRYGLDVGRITPADVHQLKQAPK